MKVLDVFGACSVGCFHSGLELKIRKFTLTGSRVCCQSDADNLGYLESEGNLAVVIAYSAYKTRGFKLQFRAGKSNQTFCEPHFTISVSYTSFSWPTWPFRGRWTM